MFVCIGFTPNPMTLLYSNPLFLEHETGRHPENPGRLTSILNRLKSTGLQARCTAGTFHPIAEEVVADVHDPAMVHRVKDQCVNDSHLDADTPVCPASYQVALAAAGACIAAVDAVLQGQDRNALCLVRPPGHHATPERSMGFCLFNNIALAAAHAQKNYDLNRILIVDWDVHHGNGTQDIFFADPTVMFLSIHRFGHGFYPGTGDEGETGTGKGLGYNLNIPVRFGLGGGEEKARREFRSRFLAALEKAADKNRPELVLVSAGFDAHCLDPIGSLGLETEDFSWLTRQVLNVAQTHAGGRLVSCLEGGYHLDALAESVEAHLVELLLEMENPGRPL